MKVKVEFDVIVHMDKVFEVPEMVSKYPSIVRECIEESIKETADNNSDIEIKRITSIDD